MTLTDASEVMYGAMLPERVLYEVMKVGFNAIQLDQGLIDDLLWKLDSAAREDIKTYFANHKVTVRQTFPKEGITFPIVVVSNGTEEEPPQSDLIGDFMHGDFDVALTQGTEVVGTANQSRYNIFLLGGNDSNLVMWMYYLAKAMCLVNRDTIARHGMHNVIFTGQDVNLREDLFPEFTYARVLTLSCLNYFSVLLTERVANSIEVNVFTEDVETGINMQLNVEEP